MVKLNCLSYIELAERIKREQKKVIVYGAGVIGQIVVPEIVKYFNLHKYICFFVDADQSKRQNFVEIDDCTYHIKSVEDLISYCKAEKNSMIWLTNSRFYSIIEELDHKEELDNIEVHIVPIMQLATFGNLEGPSIKRISKDPLIPKVIHYCWFSGNEMPDYLKKCIESWKKFCPDYEIKRWDESNYDIDKNLYMRQAWDHKKWGYIPDYARLDILYTDGGFYLDTDVELIKSLDELRYQKAFCGVEKWGIVNLGGCSGAVPKHPMIKELLREREGETFIKKDGSLNLEASGVYETRPFIKAGMRINNKMQVIKEMTIYPFEYFHPYDYMSGDTRITENTFSIHHFDGGWLDEKEKEQREKTVQKYHLIIQRMEDDERVEKG